MDAALQPADSTGGLLVVSSDAASLDHLTGALRGAGFAVRVRGQRTAGDAIRSQAPELILLDALDGVDVCRRLASDPQVAGIPILLVGDVALGAGMVRGLHAWATDYIARPWQAEEVVARVRTHVELQRLRRTQEAWPFPKLRFRNHTCGNEADSGLAEKVFESTFEAILVTDAERRVLFTNPSFTRVTGFVQAEVVGRPLTLLDSWRHDDAFRAAVIEHVEREGQWRGEAWIRRRDGNVVPTMQNVAALRDGDGRLTHYIFTLTDLSEYKDAQTLIDYLAYHDAATGLPNRIVARHHFEQCTQRAKERGGMVAVMCINVDRLPVIHHSLGRSFVDEALRRLADAIAHALDEDALVSRQSGDQFLVVSNVAGREAASAQAGRVCDAIARELVIEERRLAVTGRLGIALFPEHGEALTDLVRCADNALHRSGELGPGDWRFYSREIEAEALARMEMESHLRHAIANQELFLVYQPKVATRDGSMVGAEALLRWNSPQLGAVSPLDFIPLAAETGLILGIDSWVVREVCRQIAAWKTAGIDPGPISINLSPQQFHQANLLSTVIEALGEFGLPGSAIDLEITEGALIHEVQRATEVLRQLRAAGITLSLDDFGTGYSSLHYLKSLPIDTLKLDKSFVDELPNSRSDAAITLTVLALARHLRLSVVAEGVETAAQFDYLREHGCDLIQGYYVSKPLSAEAFEGLSKAGGALLGAGELAN